MTEEDRISATARALLDFVAEKDIWISGDGRVHEDVAAKLLGVAVGTLQNMRYEGTAPPHYKHGRITYRVRDLAEYIEAGRAA